MKLKVTSVLHTGFPPRLVGLTVPVTRIDGGYRLTEKENKHLIAMDKWIGVEPKQMQLVEDETAPEMFNWYGVQIPYGPVP